MNHTAYSSPRTRPTYHGNKTFRLRWQVVTCTILLMGTIVAAGCKPNESPSDDSTIVEDTPPIPLKMLVVGDEALGDVIARQWSARRDGELKVVSQTTVEFAKSGFDLDKSDIVIYPPGLLGELESRNNIAELPKWLWGSDELNRNELLRLHRTMLIRHGNKSWAVPLGAPQLMLTFNPIVMDQLKLKVPATWDDFVQVAATLENAGEIQDPEGNPLPTKIEFPLADGWATQVFLAASAAMIRNRGKLSTVFNRQTMEPLIEDPSFVKALDDLKKIFDAGDQQFDLTPETIFQRILAGETAIGLTWPNQAFVVDMDESDVKFDVGFALPPGSEQWYDHQSRRWNVRSKEDSDHVALIGFSGLMGSVSEKSPNSKDAFEFLEWLSTKSINLVTVVDSKESGPFRASHLGDPARWTGEKISENAANQFADVARTANDQSVVFLFPRIPGRQRYLDALNDEVVACLKGDQDSAEALNRAAVAWEKITDDLDREMQVSELKKDAGL